MKKLLLVISILSVIASVVLCAEAHPGRTDSRGGHTNHSTGEYHYHHGYSEHDHYDMDGDGKKDCPFDFRDNTDHSSRDGSSSSSFEFDISSLPTFDYNFSTFQTVESPNIPKTTTNSKSSPDFCGIMGAIFVLAVIVVFWILPIFIKRK